MNNHPNHRLATVAHSMVTGVVVAVALLAPPSARAEATLTLTLLDSRCSFITGTNEMPVSGSTPCSPSAATPVTVSNLFGLQPSSPINIASLGLTYAFTYSDDGLRLGTPATLDVGTPTADATLPRTDPNFLRVRTPQMVDYEAATVSLLLQGTNPLPYYSVHMAVSGAPADAISFQNGVLMFGLNDRPDAFSGILGIGIGSPSFPATLTGVEAGASVASVTAAVPEPSTYALMSLGLAGVAFAVRRRRRE